MQDTTTDATDEAAVEQLEQLLVQYDEQGQLFGTSGAGAYFLAKFLDEHGVTVPGVVERVQGRVDNLLATADRFDHPGGSRRLARRMRDKASGMETVLRMLGHRADVTETDAPRDLITPLMLPLLQEQLRRAAGDDPS